MSRPRSDRRWSSVEPRWLTISLSWWAASCSQNHISSVIAVMPQKRACTDNFNRSSTPSDLSVELMPGGTCATGSWARRDQVDVKPRYRTCTTQGQKTLHVLPAGCSANSSPCPGPRWLLSHLVRRILALADDPFEVHLDGFAQTTTVRRLRRDQDR